MEQELTIIYNLSALLFTISRPVSTRPTVGTLGIFHFREATHSPFLHRVLPLIHGYLLQLLLRHLLLLKFPTFRKIDPFYWWQKGGERFYGVILEVILGVFIWVFIYVLFICGHVVFCRHIFLHYSTYFVVCTLFWGWQEPLYEQIYFMISLLSLGSYVSLSFCWYIWYISSVCGMWYVCIFMCPL